MWILFHDSKFFIVREFYDFFLFFFNKFDLTQVNQNPSFEHDKSLHQAGLIFKVIKKKH